MANLPTYAQIGISAAWVVTICRIIQGMSSMGEIIGAQIYVTETIPRPLSYPTVSFITIASSLGATAALGVATLVTSFFMNWRLAFCFGAGIALVGAVARTRLRETPEFLELKRQQMKAAIAELTNEEKKEKQKPKAQQRPHWKEPIAVKTFTSYFLIFCGWPLTFYLAYMYFNPILKESFDYTPQDIIKHNFYLSFVPLASSLIWSYLSYSIHPIKLMKIRWVLAFLVLLIMPFVIMNFTSFYQVFLLQAFILTFHFGSLPAEAIFNYHLPIYRRFTFASFLYALSRALMYIVTSFGLVYLGNYFGSFGLWVITLPIGTSFLYGILHFEDLERKIGVYPNLTFQNTNNQVQIFNKMSPLNVNKTRSKKYGSDIFS
jgi:MFS family permease